jgi:hypothetical protein
MHKSSHATARLPPCPLFATDSVCVSLRSSTLALLGSPGAGDAWWTGATFAQVPEPGQAGAVAEQVVGFWHNYGVEDARGMFDALGWTVRLSPLGASGGGLQALLLPRPGGFTAVIDPNPTPQQAAAQHGAGVVRRWRLAHEYAHTFFYARRQVPRRPATASVEEEQFCDAFANALLDVSLSSVPT